MGGNTTIAEEGIQMGHLLVIEDEPCIRDLFTTVLTAAGHVVRAAPDGQAGLEEALAQPPDLILLDLVMPGLDGLQVAARLRATPETAMVPLVMVTAWDAALDRALAAGVDDFLRKPVDVGDLTLRVAALLAARAAMGVGDALQRALAYVRSLDGVRHAAGR